MFRIIVAERLEAFTSLTLVGSNWPCRLLVKPPRASLLVPPSARDRVDAPHGSMRRGAVRTFATHTRGVERVRLPLDTAPAEDGLADEVEGVLLEAGLSQILAEGTDAVGVTSAVICLQGPSHFDD